MANRNKINLTKKKLRSKNYPMPQDNIYLYSKAKPKD